MVTTNGLKDWRSCGEPNWSYVLLDQKQNLKSFRENLKTRDLGYFNGGLFLLFPFFKQKLKPKRRKKNHEKRKKKAAELVGVGEKQGNGAVYSAAGSAVAK